MKRRPSNPVLFPVIGGSLALLAGVAYVDYVTGPEIRFSLLYAAPVLIATWFAGRRAGCVMALICSVAWIVVELNEGVEYSLRAYAALNTAIRLVLLILTAYLCSAFKNLSTRLAEMVDERTHALRELSIRLSQAEELERRRLAHDVHDGLGQVLTVLKLNLTAAISESATGVIPSNRIGDAVNLITDLIDRARTLTFDLHPTMLDTLGLVPTLKHYAEQFGRQAQVEVTVNEEGRATPLSTILLNYMFRSVKELLTNAVKHGKAKQIVVSMFWGDGRLRVIVDDDGIGFDTSSVFDSRSKTGIGLAGIRERIGFLGGDFSVESIVGSGTRVVLDLLLSHAEER